jgi:hypothetical protein
VAERASKLARKRKNQNPERKALYERLKKLASERANPSKNKKDRDLLTPAERERRRGRFDWEGEGSVTKSGKKRRKQEALGEHPKKGMPHQVWEAIDMLREHPVLKKYVDPNASYDDAYATIPVRHLKKHLGWGEKELKVISKRTDPYEGDIHIEDGKATFYGGA